MTWCDEGRMPTQRDIRSIGDIEALYGGPCPSRKGQAVKLYTEDEVRIAAQLGVSRLDFLTARLAEKDGAVTFGKAEFDETDELTDDEKEVGAFLGLCESDLVGAKASGGMMTAAAIEELRARKLAAANAQTAIRRGALLQVRGWAQ